MCGKLPIHDRGWAVPKQAMKRGFWKLVCLGLLIPAANASAADRTESARILSFLKLNAFEGIRSNWDFAYASVAASKQAPPITIVYLTNRGWCGADGTGGCDFLILSVKRGRFERIGDLNVTEPIALVGRTKDGYPIFGVMTAGPPTNGATGLVRAALVPKDGKYPETSKDAWHLSSHARRGQVLISEATVVCNFRRLAPGGACQRLLDKQLFPDRAPSVLESAEPKGKR